MERQAGEDRFDPAAPGTESPRQAIEFVLRIGSALHTADSSTNELEQTIGAVARKLWLNAAQVFSTPTALRVACGELGEQRGYMLRVEPGDLHLGHLTWLDAAVEAHRDALDVVRHNAQRIRTFRVAQPLSR